MKVNRNLTIPRCGEFQKRPFCSSKYLKQSESISHQQEGSSFPEFSLFYFSWVTSLHKNRSRQSSFSEKKKERPPTWTPAQSLKRSSGTLAGLALMSPPFNGGAQRRLDDDQRISEFFRFHREESFSGQFLLLKNFSYYLKRGFFVGFWRTFRLLLLNIQQICALFLAFRVLSLPISGPLAFRPWTRYIM